jgi:hypothetical protein
MKLLIMQWWSLCRGGPPAWGLGVGLTTPHRKKLACYENSQEASDCSYYKKQYMVLHVAVLRDI